MRSPAARRAEIVGRLRSAGCVFAEDEAELLISSAGSSAELSAMVARRADGFPLEQVLGWAWFCGVRIVVAPGVFVPRARTELLVRQVLALLGAGPATVVDLCCGSGAVATAVAAGVGAARAGAAVAAGVGAARAGAGVAEMAVVGCGATVGRGAVGSADPIRLYAADIDPAAVACARRNLHGYGATVYQGDLFQALPEHLRGRIDVLVANVPYVPTAKIDLLPPEARLHEPRLALDGGGDGLDVMRRLVAQAPAWLASGGHLLVESSRRQAGTAADIFTATGLAAYVVHDDELDATVIVGGGRGFAGRGRG